MGISIHALREEGDLTCLHRSGAAHNFYPRPPRGGRQYLYRSYHTLGGFLSTPSARRATAVAGPARYNAKFLSTPSARRATGMPLGVEPSQQISIHALREEGDLVQS